MPCHVFKQNIYTYLHIAVLRPARLYHTIIISYHHENQEHQYEIIKSALSAHIISYKSNITHLNHNAAQERHPEVVCDSLLSTHQNL